MMEHKSGKFTNVGCCISLNSRRMMGLSLLVIVLGLFLVVVPQLGQTQYMVVCESDESTSEHSLQKQQQDEYYPCRFALDFTIADFFNNSIRTQQFLMNVSHWEGKFATHGVGLNMISGLTYDGHQIDYDTSELHDPLHAFSAASKESLHLDMIALALSGDRIAMNFFKSSMESSASVRFSFSPKKQSLRSYAKDLQEDKVQQFILSSLKTKLQSYEKFDNKYPGFGGLLPWFSVGDDGAELLEGWTDRVPSLDNGQMIWGLIAVEQALRQQKIGLDLADTIAARIKKITQTVLPIFYDGNGNVRCVAKIKNVYGSPYNANNYASDGECYLDDPYEGELMDFFIDLKADWAASGYSLNERNKIWIAKRSKTRAVKYRSKLYGDILVEQGFWYSSHEKWKYLVLPYSSVPVNNRIFLNGERARLVNSIENGIPGLMASVTVPVPRGDYSPPYSSACGIAQIASQPIQYTTIITPYGSFPPALADKNIGLMWYLTSIQGAKMQGVYGSTESTNITGSAICPVTTWDSKVTTLVSLCGGVSKLTSNYMVNYGIYERFYQIVDTEWTRVFGIGPYVGEQIPLDKLRPTINIPQNMVDFTMCAKSNGKFDAVKVSRH